MLRFFSIASRLPPHPVHTIAMANLIQVMLQQTEVELHFHRLADVDVFAIGKPHCNAHRPFGMSSRCYDML